MIFVDAVAWIYIYDSSQPAAQRNLAMSVVKRTKERFCTSDLVIAETHKWLCHHGRSLSRSSEILTTLTNEQVAHILEVEAADRHLAANLVAKYLDQKLSYADALSVALMRRHGIRKILSFDKHFLLFKDITRIP